MSSVIDTLSCNADQVSDSDEEINTYESGSIVPGEAPESDEEYHLTEIITPLTPESSPKKTKDTIYSKYDTLLHRKLREQNEKLRNEIFKICCQPYISATKEVNLLTQKLIKLQKMVQIVSGDLRKLSKDIIHLETVLNVLKINSDALPNFCNKIDESH